MTEPNVRMWGEYSLALARNPAQLHRWRLVIREAAAAGPSPVIVDLGCGNGALLSRLRALSGKKLIGIDVEPRALEIARAQLPEAQFYLGDLNSANNAELLALQGQADIVTSSEVLEHLAKPEAALKLASRLLRPNGILVITVPTGPMNDFDRSIGHLRHYTIESLSDLLTGNGFRVHRCYAWGFPFHTAFRIAIGAVPSVLDGFSDKKITAPKRILFRALDLLFHFNIRSRHVGRQLVAVASPAA